MRHWQPRNTYQTYERLRKTGRFNASPPFVLATGFLVLILLGTLLLSLPIATHQPISLFTAIFTATSAVTVTGLTLVDPGSTFTVFGQIVMAILVQIGGLGFVTFAVVAALTLGKKIGLRQQALVLEAFNQTSVSQITRTALAVMKIAAGIEIVAIVIFTLWWWPDSDFVTALYNAIFHTISAFNNSGLSLHPDSLKGFVNDPVVILGTSALIILGGIGFMVLTEVGTQRHWTPLRPYTKIVLIGTLALNLFGFVAIWSLEWNNPGTLGGLSLQGQALASWLQSVASRTAGFSSIDVAQMTDPSTLVLIFLMFIGGGSLSAASGIKIGTFIVLLAATYSYISGRNEIVLFQRSISPEVVQKALALLLVTIGLAFVAIFLISIFENAPFMSIVFEVFSALSTTGMDRGLTPHLSTASHCVLIVLMYAGRLGPLTLVYSLATRSRSRVRYPETGFQVG